jgi:hypothetical protein
VSAWLGLGVREAGGVDLRDAPRPRGNDGEAVNPWIHTFGDQWIDLLSPSVEQTRKVGLVGLGWALSQIVRFTGHPDQHYSVAQHCINVGAWLATVAGRPDLQLAGLIHDAPEAVTGDPSKPYQIALEIEWLQGRLYAGAVPSDSRAVDDARRGWYHPRGPTAAYKRLAARHYDAIAEAFGCAPLTPEDRVLVKRADNVMLRTEREAFFGRLSDPEREALWLHGCADEEPWGAFCTWLEGGGDAVYVGPDLQAHASSDVARRWISACRLAGAHE